MTTQTTGFAPAKVNLALHVTGQRSDGYHLLDSLVVFADIGDHVHLRAAPEMSLSVTGPRAAGVPADARNLCWKAAEACGQTVAITLDKHLPAAAGIGGGSADAAAVLRGMQALFGAGADALALGADVPVCLAGRSARMQGIGEEVTPVNTPRWPAVLVNPGVEVSTPEVFRALPTKDNAPMAPWPAQIDMAWLRAQRNDLEPPARALRPVITEVLEALAMEAALARMSGSGATCFGLYDSWAGAERAAARIRAAQPGWWVSACHLGG